MERLFILTAAALVYKGIDYLLGYDTSLLMYVILVGVQIDLMEKT